MQNYLKEVFRYDHSIEKALVFQVFPDRNYEIKELMDDSESLDSHPVISNRRVHISKNKALQDGLKKAYRQKSK